MLEKEVVVAQRKWEVPPVKTSDEQLLLQASACRIIPDSVKLGIIWCTANKALIAAQTSADFCTSLFAF